MKKNNYLAGAMLALMMSATSTVNAQWQLTGNSNATTSSFIGTTTAKDFVIKTGGSTSTYERMRVLSTGNVGIGLNNPNCRLHVTSNTGASLTGAGMLTIGGITSNNLVFDGDDIQSRNNNIAGSLYLNQYGGGVWIGNDPGSTSYSPVIHAGGTSGNVGIGTQANGTNRLLVNGSTSSTDGVFRSKANYTGTSVDVNAVEGNSTSIAGYGTGVKGVGGFIGIYGVGNGSTGRNNYGIYGESSGSTSHNYGVHASANGPSSATNIGVYGTATGGTDNWGGYFDTKVFIDELRVGSELMATGYKVNVDGKIICEELRVQNSTDWPDYVFDDGYNLMPIDEMEKSIIENKHLPGIPSASEVKEKGLHLGDMQVRMMEKIEQLSLYIIDLKHQKDELANRVALLENK